MNDTLTAPAAPAVATKPEDIEAHDLSLFEGLDKLDAKLDPAARRDLQSSVEGMDDADNEKAAAVNIAWTARQMNREPEEVSANWESIRDEVASTVVGKPQTNVSDKALYGLIGQHLQKQKATRQLVGSIYQKMDEAAFSGVDWMSAYREMQPDFEKHAGYDPEKSDDLRALAKARWQAAKDSAPRVGELSQALAGYYTHLSENGLDSAAEAQRADILQKISALTPHEQHAVFTYGGAMAAKHIGAATEAGQVENDFGANFTTALDRGIANLGESTVRGAKVLGQKIINAVRVGDMMKPIDYSATNQADSLAAQLDKTYADVAAKLPADHWYEKMAYNGAEMAPQIVPAAINPLAGGTILALSMGDQATQSLIQKGVDPEKAQNLGLITGGVQAALFGGMGKIVRGVAPGVDKAIASLFEAETKSLGQLALKTITVGGYSTAAANLDQALVDATPHVIQSLASKLDSSIPGVDWKTTLEQFKSSRLDTFLTLFPVALVGTGHFALQEGSRMRALIKDPDVLTALGVPKAGQEALANAKTAEDATDILQHYTKESYEALLSGASGNEAAVPLKEREAAIERLNAKQPAPAEFLGIQEGIPGHIPDLELWNLKEDVGDHPANSTVSRQTIEKAGYELPKVRAERQADGSFLVYDETGALIDRAGDASEASALIHEHLAGQEVEAKEPTALPPPVTAEAYKASPFALGAAVNIPGLHGTIDALTKAREGLVSWARSFAPERVLSARLDAANNKAMRFARQTANTVSNALKRTMQREKRTAIDERALTFVVEAKRDLATLQDFKTRLDNIKGTGLPFGAIYEAKKAVDHAIANFQRLVPVAMEYEKATDAQVAKEQAMGFSVAKREGYVPHQQEIDTGVAQLFERGGGSGASGSHRHARAFDTFVDSLEAGYKPKSLNAVTLLENRINNGERAINRKLWAEGGKSVIDPSTNRPVFADPVVGTKVVNGQTVPDITAPKGYTLLPFGGTQIAVHDGYVGLFKSLNDTSAFNNSVAGRAALQAAGGIKHGVIAIDTFHLGRVAYHLMTLKGKPSYGKGLLLLDYSTDEIHRMVQSGEIAPAVAAKLMPELDRSKANLDLLMNEGLNVGAIGDAMHREFSEKVLSRVGVGDVNIANFSKWLFGSFQRGGMVEAALLEFDRIRANSPHLTDVEVARQVAKDVNTRFGNLQNQSWVKSKTFHDLMRLAFLAPGWNEGLIRSELGAYKQIGESALTLATQRRLVAGTLMRNVGGLLLGQFIMNQVINYITRGKPTWDNEEEDLSSKISAYIPDHIGSGPGFFLNPFSLPAEITGQVVRQIEKKGDLVEAVKDVMGYKVGPFGKSVLTLGTGRDSSGHAVRGAERVQAALHDLAPIPMQLPAVISAVKSASGGKVSEHVPGELQKQVVGSVGVKLENAPSATQRIGHLAQEFKREHNLKTPPVYGESDYGPFITALRTGNETDEKAALQELLKAKKPEQIAHYFALYARRAFTDSKAHEAQFVEGLTTEQKATYEKAREERTQITHRAFDLLSTIPPAQPEE